MNWLKKFLFLLIKSKNTTIDPADLPSSFYLGQPYVEDQNKVDCSIEMQFVFPASMKRVEFYLYKSRIILDQDGSLLKVRFEKTISEKLWNNVYKSHKGEGFILSYAARLMPEINRRLLENRYLSGHPLSRTFSIMDTLGIYLIKGNKSVRLHWPGSISNFPPSESLAREKDEIYIRDYIDAMHSYFKNDYDDCLRRVITATENLFKVRKFKGKKGINSFKSILYNNLDTTAFSGKVIADNLAFIYKLRNKIVHDRFRLKPSNGYICKKAIGSLNYLLQRLSGDMQTVAYVTSLSGQFLMLQNFLGQGPTLDDIERMEKDHTPPDSSQIINTQEDMDKWMFRSLQIKEKEKSILLKN